MLYISLFFILSGAMLLLYAVITGISEKKVYTPVQPTGTARQSARPVQKERGEEERVFPAEKLAAGDAVALHEHGEPGTQRVRVYEETYESAEGGQKAEVREVSELHGDDETSSAGFNEDPVAVEENPDSAEAVLYEDASRLVDYSREKGIIDKDFEHYRDIRRVDDGNLVLEKEGLSFYCGRKLFRFDFMKVEKIYFSRNTIAVIYGAGSPVRLFLLGEEVPLLKRARKAYDDFVEHMAALGQ